MNGAMADWLCSGLQIRLVRFDSGSCLQNKFPIFGITLYRGLLKDRRYFPFHLR